MTHAAIALDFDFPTISNDNLDAVTGGVTREQAQNFGGQVAEVGAVAGGAALGTALGGPGGAAVGAAAGEVANRTGASNAVGRAVGGAVYDGVSAVGNAASSAWSWGRRQLGY